MPRPEIPPGGSGEPSPKEVRRNLWTARVRWRDSRGTYHETTERSTSKQKVLDALSKKVAAERKKYDAPDVLPLLGNVALEWFEHLQGLVRNEEITDSTAAQYWACWTGTLKRAFAHIDVNDLTRKQA